MRTTTEASTGDNFTKPSPNVALYIRKSREDENDKEHTLDTQRMILKHLASSKGIEDYDIYQEVESSIKIDRPELTRLLKNIGQYTHILVTHIDRLGRDIGLLDDIKKLCKEHGVSIITPEQKITFDDDNQDLLYGFSSVLSDFEYKRIRYRLLKGKLDAVKHKGKFLQSVPPYGYYIDKDTHKLVEDPETSPGLKLIFELALQNYSHREIAEKLNERGYRTVRGNEFKDSTIRLILRNRHYLGEIHFNSKSMKENVVIENAHPPLVSEQDFKRIQKLTSTRASSPKMKYLGVKSSLDGLLKCPRCGYFYTIKKSRNVNKTKQKRHKAHAEKCRYPRKSDDTMCPTKGFQLYVVEEIVFERLARKEEEIRKDLNMLLSNDTSDQEEVLYEKASAIETQVKRKRTALGRLLDLFLDQGIDKEAYTEKKNTLEQQLSVLEGDYTAISNEIVTLDTSNVSEELTHSLDIIKMIHESDLPDQNRLLRQIIKDIEVYRVDDNIDITINWL